MILAFRTLSVLFLQYFTADFRGIEEFYSAEMALLDKSAENNLIFSENL